MSNAKVKLLVSYWQSLALLSVFFWAGTLPAQQSTLPGDGVSSPTVDQNQTVIFDTVFFERYKPNTALDMVRQVPGFLIDDGDSTRGFASATGNILINTRYPSAKQDRPSAILARIPASQVERIELIRGQVREIDMQGQAVVVNVRLRNDTPLTVQWTLSVEQNNTAPIRPRGIISVSDRFADIDYIAGIDVERDSSGFFGTEDIVDSTGVLTEQRTEDSSESGYRVNGLYMNASTWVDETLVQINSKFGMHRSDTLHSSYRVPLTDALPRTVSILNEGESYQLELGADAERFLAADLVGKAILLFFHKTDTPLVTQSTVDLEGNPMFSRVADGETVSSEAIARLEFGWARFPQHLIQLNLEGAYNALEGSLYMADDTGTGPEVVSIPGANTTVNEYRGELLLKDTWTLGPFELDYGLGAEISTISQSGDAEQERSFFFVKPQAVLNYASSPSARTRLRLAREVAQLNFSDFVSSTVFEDDDVNRGNPELQPDSSWILDLGHEKRFGELSVLKLTVFYHWISDVLDLLPISPTLEVPGNIGDGKRWGAELEGTMPLEWLGLSGARMDIKTHWQDSSVTDPDTGQQRVLSGQSGSDSYQTVSNLRKNNRRYIRIDYRQDFEDLRFAWGWTIAERDRRPLFKVNELEVHDEGLAIDAFIETTRWAGMKMRFSVENILDHILIRDRTVFTGRRDLSPVDFYLFRDRYTGRRLTLSLNGRF